MPVKYRNDDAMQDFIDKQFFNLTLFTLIFGVIFYDAIQILGFSYVDEICAVLLLWLFGYKVAQSKTWEFNRLFLTTIAVFLFYLFYSLAIHSNTKAAILMDFVIQIKPYLAFFCVYALHPQFSAGQKKIIRQLIVLCSLYVLTVGVSSVAYSEIMDYTFFHPSRLATASTVLALLYLYCSDYAKRDKLVFILILAIGILSGRSKHYGIFMLYLLIILYFNRSFEMKFNMRNSLFLIVATLFTVFVAWPKIHFYFIVGGFGQDRETRDLYARAALYFFSSKVFMDFIPFGSGFASYATFASGDFYSPLYAKYGMENMHGLSRSDGGFIADTYYPSLAQFGFAGVLLFLMFWANLAVKAIKAYKWNLKKESTMAIMIIMFFLIESTSDATITHNRGMFIMMLLGLLFFDIRSGIAKFKNDKTLQNDENITC